jgi:large subunit ribosomal protein L9
MEVILREDVKDLGRSGDVVKVSPGFARNYLVPQNLAVLATGKNLKELEHQKRVISKHADEQRKLAADLAGKLKGLSVTVAKPVGESDRLYGSVTPRDVAQALVEEGVNDVDRKQITIDDAIRTLGIYTVPVRLSAENVAEIKLWVVAKE